MPLTITRTDAHHADFIALVRELDAELAVRDGDDHAFYDQFNKITHINEVVVLYEDKNAAACGAFKPYENKTVEIKRMFTQVTHRGRGLAIQVLHELERWAAELGYERCILETGLAQPEAIALYKKCGYALIPNYGQYAGVENSVCFEKNLI